jgi:hypothetical protein
MRFSEAVQRMRDGYAIRRPHFHPEAALVLVPGSTIVVDADRPLGRALPHLVGATVRYAEHIDIVTRSGLVHVWQPTQADVMADDWTGV